MEGERGGEGKLEGEEEYNLTSFHRPPPSAFTVPPPQMSYGGYEFNASSSSDPMQTSPSGPASAPVDKKARKPTSEQTMIPCTIRQLLQSRSSEGGSGAVTVDGAEPHHVKVCACVKEVDVSATSVTYQVEDGSGLIEVKQWINDASDTEAARERRGRVKEGLYVKVVGKPNFFNGTVSISAYSVKVSGGPRGEGESGGGGGGLLARGGGMNVR